MAWATPADVRSYTGINVGEDNIDAAQAVIEMYSGTTETASDNNRISSKNLRLLKLAVSYQAAWLSTHPEAFSNLDLAEVTEGAGGLQYKPMHAEALILSPLAKRSLSRLSWMQSRSVRVRPANRRARLRLEYRNSLRNDFYDEDDEGNGVWRPL